jgi:hypothetical protein
MIEDNKSLGYSKYHTCSKLKERIMLMDIYSINFNTISPCNTCEKKEQCTLQVKETQRSIQQFKQDIFKLIFSTPNINDSTRLNTSRIQFKTPSDESQALKIMKFNIKQFDQYDKWLLFLNSIYAEPKVIAIKKDTSKYDNCVETLSIDLDEPIKKDLSKYAKCKDVISIDLD